MKFSINQSELQNALSVVLKGIATRSTLPILSGIYLDAHDDTLTLQATDLELSIQYSVSALIEETGKAVVPGKLFSEIVKNLPDAAVHVAAEDDSAVITCDTASFSIKTLDAEDFPGFPHVDVQQEVSIPFTQFASMVKRVARVVSKDESRAILTGVLITLEDTTLKMVATDSYRLAITEAELPESSAEEFQAVIAGSFLQEISSLPRSEDDLKLALAENQIVVTYHDTAQDVGSAQETLSCEGEGEDVEIAFNYAYVLDGLSSVSTDNVFLEVQSSMKPGIFKADEGENFLYLVMPVRIA